VILLCSRGWWTANALDLYSSGALFESRRGTGICIIIQHFVWNISRHVWMIILK
jgi:hypothetical protein